MTDNLLVMSNHFKTIYWLKNQLCPEDLDWIVAVHQTSDMLTFANKRSHLSNDPNAWIDETIYQPPYVSTAPYILLDLGNADTVRYILLRLGQEDDIVAVRTTSGPKTLEIANSINVFNPAWGGPTGVPGDIPPLSSGVVVPGGNWIPADDMRTSELSEMLGIPQTDELMPYIVDALRNEGEFERLVNSPVAFLNEAATARNLEAAADVIETLGNRINVRQQDLAGFQRFR